MAYIQEDQKSRIVNYNAKNASTTRTYHLFDYVDSQDALAALTSYVPSDILVGNYLCVLPEFTITPVFSDPEHTLYQGMVAWKTADIAKGGSEGGGDAPKDPQKPEDPTSLSVSFTGLSEVIQNSNGIIENNVIVRNGTRIVPPAGQNTASLSEYINQQHSELAPEGVEVNRPIITITAKTVIPWTTATPTWFKNLYAQVWTTNDAVWNTLEKNCVMLTGVNADQRSDDHWDVTYTFEYRPPRKQETFRYFQKDNTGKYSAPATMILPDYTGWEVLDARYEDLVVRQRVTVGEGQAGGDEATRNLTSVMLHHVYGESDFSQLGMVGVN